MAHPRVFAGQTVVGNRYTLVAPLGRGGMGEVWEANDTRLGQKVAVKLLATGGQGTDLDVLRFTREASVTAGIVHSGVPAVFDAGTYDGGLYLAMELVAGCTLADLVSEQGPLPVGWAATIAGQVAAVLAVAHQHEVVHRDIKPQNVMLTPDGTAKVLDFGVAGIAAQRLTSTGVTVGTTGYIAPELFHNYPATPQADLYALGCVLHEMLAGEPVFAAGSPAALIRMHLEQAPPPLRRPDVPPQLQALVWQLLEKDPSRRPADARQVYERLLPFVTPPGPLGGIDPRAGNRTGTQLYARLLARLTEAEPGWTGEPSRTGEPAWTGARGWSGEPGWAGPTAGQYGGHAAMTRDAGRARSSVWWMLPTLLLFGLGAWLSFGYIGARYRRVPWLAVAVGYLALAIVTCVLLSNSPAFSVDDPTPLSATIGVSMLAALWAVSIVHALWVHFGGLKQARAAR